MDETEVQTEQWLLDLIEELELEGGWDLPEMVASAVVDQMQALAEREGRTVTRDDLASAVRQFYDSWSTYRQVEMWQAGTWWVDWFEGTLSWQDAPVVVG